MGNFLDKFKGVGQSIDKRANDYANRPKQPQKFGKIVEKKTGDMGSGLVDGFDKGFDDINFNDSMMSDMGFDDSMMGGMGFNDPYGIGIQPAQKPESFHHFILENQYKDLEKSIRGYKDVYNKQTREWEIKRKDGHCFTDEEAEEILRTAQSHLATDIKLSFINKEVFGLMMMAIFKRLDELFYSIAEYRYGRYGDPEIQYAMKLQNRKIFLELWTRVQANYSRAIQGAENNATHNSVKGQESLQQTDRMMDKNRRLI